MYSRRFVIVEETHKLFFSKKVMYGYTLQNQTVYKLVFSDSLSEARHFRTEREALDLLDSLPPTDTFMHVLAYKEKLKLKFADLTVIPISIIYDA